MWEPVIGLEVHVQLSTKSKIFSSASTNFGLEQNTQACSIDLGMPGVLPVLNEQAVIMAIKFGLSINATISNKSIFARKNYFYPDLPKGYQISQYELPIVSKGSIDIENRDGKKSIGITRAHLEEDAGKSIHDLYKDESAIDLNRAGTPLIEIVSEPELSNAEEAVSYLKKIHTLVKYLEISDGNPGPGSYGYMIQKNDETVIDEGHGVSKLTTNNKMELTAVIEALKAVENSVTPMHEVFIYTDSKYVVDGMKSWVAGWKRRGWKKADKKEPENLDLWKELDRLSQICHSQFLWVKGHAGHPQNEYVDGLANKALDEAGF